MKKADRISRKNFRKNRLLFHLFVVCGGGAGRKTGKNIFSEAREGLEKRVSRKFESYMTEKPCTFWTPRHAKNPGISWVFWGGIFFVLPFWLCGTKKIPVFNDIGLAGNNSPSG